MKKLLKNLFKNSLQKGFTLIELLVVITVLAVLATIVLLAVNPGMQLARARDANRKQTLAALSKALEQYYVFNGAYPSPTTGLTSDSSGGGSWIQGLVPDYLKTLPKDPKQASLSFFIAFNGLLEKIGGMVVKAQIPTTFTNTVVDYTKQLQSLSPITFGMDESGYGWTGSQGLDLTRDPKQQTMLKNLKVAQMRINLGYATPGNSASAIVCRQSGCDSSVPGMTWVNSVIAAGAEPEIEVQMLLGQEANWAVDAANMVRYFNITNKKNVKRWVIGNEPDNNGLSATAYSNGFKLMYDAMKAVDPTIKIGGPTTAWYNRGFIDTFLSIVGTRPDFIDYHDYGEGGSNILTDANLLASTNKYENNAHDLRTLINSRMGVTRGSQVEIELGEWNMSWSAVGSQLTHLNTIWSASALGHMLRAGVIERQYADKNDALGALCQTANPTQGGVNYSCDVDDPMPIYHGIGMFTGENLFPAFGNKLIFTSTSLNNTEFFASDNPRNIVAVNKSPTSTENAVFNLIGLGGPTGTVSVWQKGLNDMAPVNKGNVAISNNSFSYNIVPYSVTTFIINSSAPLPSPTHSPTPSPTPSPGPLAFKYLYTVTSDFQSFTLWAGLENSDDPEIYNKPGAKCQRTPPSSGYNYCVSSN